MTSHTDTHRKYSNAHISDVGGEYAKHSNVILINSRRTITVAATVIFYLLIPGERHISYNIICMTIRNYVVMLTGLFSRYYRISDIWAS